MSQADDLLNSLIVDNSQEHIIISNDRSILVPDNLKKIAVQYDHNIETVTFDCPRYWDGIDMSKMRIYINYIRSDGGMGSYLVSEVSIDENDNTIMHFDWTITRNVTQSAGGLKFLVCIKNSDIYGNEKNHWNSNLNKDMHIVEGLEVTETIENMHADVIYQLLTRMDEAEKTVENMYANSFSTFFVDDDGNLWLYSVDDASMTFEYDSATGNLYRILEV